jgi:hypothetical protein
VVTILVTLLSTTEIVTMNLSFDHPGRLEDWLALTSLPTFQAFTDFKLHPNLFFPFGVIKGRQCIMAKKLPQS